MNELEAKCYLTKKGGANNSDHTCIQDNQHCCTRYSLQSYYTYRNLESLKVFIFPQLYIYVHIYLYVDPKIIWTLLSRWESNPKRNSDNK